MTRNINIKGWRGSYKNEAAIVVLCDPSCPDFRLAGEDSKHTTRKR